MTESRISFDLEEAESWKRIAHVTVEPSLMEEMRDKAAQRLSGAKPQPQSGEPLANASSQLPMTTVVTPWAEEGTR